MRSLNRHAVNPANAALAIDVIDGAGPGGANHLYEISGFTDKSNVSHPLVRNHGYPLDRCVLLFQNGAIGEVGVNGITHEALLAVLIDRLKGFQAGQYACRENALALTKLEEALFWLNERTRARMDRNVEGTMEV